MNTEEESSLCYICRNPVEAHNEMRVAVFNCRLCGNYSGPLWLEQSGLPEKDRHFVMCAVRNRDEQGHSVRFSESEDDIRILRDSVVPPTTPVGIVDLLLEHIARKSRGLFAEQVTIAAEWDYPLVFAHSARELEYHVDNAKELGYLKGELESTQADLAGTKIIGDRRWQLTLTLKGWQRIENIKRTGRNPTKAFVAMWFDKQLDEAWTNGFKVALKEAGYEEPIRIDNQEHNNKICDEIVAEIRKSALVVADFTGHRGGVYFEAGFAKGLGIPVIFTCQKDHIGDAHFDTRQYNHIVWEGPEDLRKKLLNRIESTMPKTRSEPHTVFQAED